MSFLSRLRRFSHEPQINAIARQAAARARDSVWQRVCQRIPMMQINEARGYIRARAAAIVAREVDAALTGQRRVRKTARARIIEATHEIIFRAAFSHARTVQPAVVSVRKAA